MNWISKQFLPLSPSYSMTHNLDWSYIRIMLWYENSIQMDWSNQWNSKFLDEYSNQNELVSFSMKSIVRWTNQFRKMVNFVKFHEICVQKKKRANVYEIPTKSFFFLNVLFPPKKKK